MSTVVLQSFLEAIAFKISGGDEYCWNCYGNHARSIDYYNEWTDVSVSAIFDTKTQEVFEITLAEKERAVRWIHPGFRDKYFDEATKRNLNPMTAWDDVQYRDTDLIEILVCIKELVGDSTRGE